MSGSPERAQSSRARNQNFRILMRIDPLMCAMMLREALRVSKDEREAAWRLGISVDRMRSSVMQLADDGVFGRLDE